MKQRVIVFTDKSIMKNQDSRSPLGNYDEAALRDVLERYFPARCYDVETVDYPLSRCFHNINDMWMQVRMPIIIGFGKGANYIVNVKNYKRKYIISPDFKDMASNILCDTDEYDESNTVCLFGGDEKSLRNAEECSKYLPDTTISGLCEGRLDFIEAIHYIGIYDLLMFKSKTPV